MNGAIACENRMPTPETGVVRPDPSHFCSVEEMQATCEEEGWSIEFRQLQGGNLTSSLVSGSCADISLLDHEFSRRIEVVGESPDGYVTVLAPVGRAEFRINGQSFGGHGVFLLGPKHGQDRGEHNGFHVVCPIRQEIIAIQGLPSLSGLVLADSRL